MLQAKTGTEKPLYQGHGSVVKNPPAMQEMQVPSMGYKDPLEKEIAVHSREREKGCS